MRTQFVARPYALFAYIAAFSLFLPGTAHADSLPNLSTSSLTVLVSVDGHADHAALREMKQELSSIMQEAGRKVEVRLRTEAARDETFDDVVLVKLKGNCKVDRLIPYMDERGPLAFTHVTDGVILPFAQVECDRLSRSIGQALYGEERKQPGKYLGRAIGRVVAHELYHILGKTHEHNHDGSLAKEAISAKRLIADKRLSFDVQDMSRMLP
ncbi:MAG: hypothetical protein NW208_13145 [Bryobacter sp.]|nr:hypothetical protein [Bryobacter sp.]